MSELPSPGRSANRRILAGVAVSTAFLLAVLVALCAPTTSSAQEAPAPPGFFGVNSSGYVNGDAERMAEANVGVTRQVFPFQVLKQGRKKPYHWSYSDPIVKATATSGIDLIAMIYGSPPWISTDLNHTVIRGQGKQAWSDLLQALVERYGPGGTFWSLPENEYVPYRPITTWQIWNEPNSITWWGPRPKPTEYAQLLLRSEATIHSVDPSAQILTAGVVAKPTNAHAIPGPKFLKELFRVPGVAEAADAVAYHPYSRSVSGVRKQLQVARNVLSHDGVADTPLWITEIGWGSKGPADLPLVKSLAGQNRAMRDTFQMAIDNREKLGIGRVLWYQWRDGTDTLCKWCETSGLLNRKSKPKELYDTFASIAVR